MIDPYQEIEGPCVVDPSTCPEPTAWAFSNTVDWYVMQASILVNGFSFKAYIADAYACRRTIEQDPSIDPLTLQNFFSDWEQYQFNFVKYIIGQPDNTTPQKLKFCYPMTAGIKDRFPMLERPDVVGSVRDLVGDSFTCPGYYTNVFTAQGYTWPDLSKATFQLASNGVQTGLYLLLWIPRVFGITNLFSGLLWRESWAQDNNENDYTAFVCAMTQGSGSFLVICLILTLLYYLVRAMWVWLVHIAVSLVEILYILFRVRHRLDPEQRNEFVRNMAAAPAWF